MRAGIKNLLIAILFGLILPGILLNGILKSEPQPATEATVPTQTEPAVGLLIPVLTAENQMQLMDLEDYVTGVLLREIPSDFHHEAMKAQAVAARTYALRRYLGASKHENASVCTDPSCCQAFQSPETYITEGGSQAGLRQIRKAVQDTAGEVLYYGGSLIEATYFSSSGGMTEAAVAVWGQDIPYLQATESPGEEDAAHHTDTVTFTWEEISDKLNFSLFGTPESRFTDIRYTVGGGVESLRICNECYTGKQLRELLGLRSTAFSIYPSEDNVSFVTRGYGHRVGMSQYGADAMARSGSNYRQILSYYYKDTEIGDCGAIQ